MLLLSCSLWCEVQRRARGKQSQWGKWHSGTVLGLQSSHLEKGSGREEHDMTPFNCVFLFQLLVLCSSSLSYECCLQPEIYRIVFLWSSGLLKGNTFPFYIEIKSCNGEGHSELLRLIGTSWLDPIRTAARTKDSYTKKFATTHHALPPSGLLKVLCWNPSGVWVFGHEPAALPGPAMKPSVLETDILGLTSLCAGHMV